MKQHINSEQLDELSEESKKKLRKWWKPQEGDIFIDPDWTGEQICNGVEGGYPLSGNEYTSKNKSILPLLSIGQMIEFLEEYPDDNLGVIFQNSGETKVGAIDIQFHGELCDALWETVKERLI